MHGLGDSADGFADVAEMLSTQLPYVKFILPTAPSSPVSLNGGMVMNSWYDIVGLDDRAAETCDGLDESRRIVTNIIESEVAAGIPHSRIVLAGFSQVDPSSSLSCAHIV
jgi:lysophospholipase II